MVMMKFPSVDIVSPVFAASFWWVSDCLWKASGRPQSVRAHASGLCLHQRFAVSHRRNHRRLTSYDESVFGGTLRMVMTGIGRFLKTIRPHQPVARLLVCISAGMGVCFSQTDGTKDVNGWSKANWAMTAEQVIQAFKDEGAIPSKGLGLECDSAVEIPTFQFGAQERKTPLAKAKFRVTFDADEWSHRLCRITIRPIRSVRFDDVKTMLIKQYGEPKSVDTNKLMPKAYWFFQSTSISLWGDWNNVDNIRFAPQKPQERQKLFTPPVIQSTGVSVSAEPSVAAKVQPNESNPGAPSSAVLSGKAFLVTNGGDLMVARFGQVFALTGEAAIQFSKNAQFVNYEESVDYLRAIAPSSGTQQAMLRLQCVENLMKHFEMANDLKKAYPASVSTLASDEEGAFKLKGLRPGSYTILVFGRGGANAALWMDQVSVESGKDEPLKMHTTKLGCFDPQGLAKF